MIVIPTDGLEEAWGSAEAEPGRERLWDFGWENRTKSAAEVIKAIHDATRENASGERQADDMTAIVIKVVDKKEF